MCVYFGLSLESDRRTTLTTEILGVVYGGFLFFGSQLKRKGGLTVLYTLKEAGLGPFEFCRYLLEGLSLSFVLAVLLRMLFTWLMHAEPALVKERKTELPRWARILSAAMIMVLCWLPFFLAFYPGMLSPDSIDELYQQLGIKALSNHHPVMHQMLIRVCLCLGLKFGSVTLGTAIYSVVQMSLLALVYAINLETMRDYHVPCGFRLAILCTYALFPLNAALLIAKRRGTVAAAMFPLATVWLTTLASPVNAEHRYLFSLTVCVPIFLALAVWMPKENEPEG